MEKKYDIFISYSWADSEIATRIYQYLTKAGFSCCYDKESFHGGADFPKVTADNIINSEVFLYLGSKNSFSSGWAPDEVAFAKSHKKRGNLLYYAIDNNSMPYWMELAFAAINRRNIYEHPIESILAEDIKRILNNDVIEDSETSSQSLLSNERFPLLEELRKRAELGGSKEMELYTSAQIILSNIIPIYDYGWEKEYFVIRLLGKDKIDFESQTALNVMDIYMLCISIRLFLCDKNILEQYILYIPIEDTKNMILNICLNKTKKEDLNIYELTNSNDSYSFVNDVLQIVYKAFNFEEKLWECNDNKNNVFIDVVNGNCIQFSAYCKMPHDYYLMINHIRQFKQIVNDLYCKTEYKKKCYKLQYKVYPAERTISYNESLYRIKADTQITIDQANILKLLTGVKLYNNPLACLRELYQNALDACRRRLYSRDTTIERCSITFGTKRTKEGVFLYCQDNGVGMDEYIIENYLLRIGTSYYKSDDFMQERKVMIKDFSPISQFGIGIVSCFMIASRIEVITKSVKPESKAIKFCINDVTGNIYYDLEIPYENEKHLAQGGTVVRILLNEHYASLICTKKIEKLWESYIGHPYANINNNYNLHGFYNNIENSISKFNHQEASCTNYLYSILSTFICRFPDNIDVFVEEENGGLISLKRMPFALKCGEMGLTLKDALLLDKRSKQFVDSRWNFCHIYQMSPIQYKDVYFYPIVVLPTRDVEVRIKEKSFPWAKYSSFDSVIEKSDEEVEIIQEIDVSSFVVGRGITVDGIFVEGVKLGLSNYGIIDYSGQSKPILSVDRTKIISYPSDNDAILKRLEDSFRCKYKELVEKHVDKYQLNDDTKSAIEGLSIWYYENLQDNELPRRRLRI